MADVLVSFAFLFFLILCTLKYKSSSFVYVYALWYVLILIDYACMQSVLTSHGTVTSRFAASHHCSLRISPLRSLLVDYPDAKILGHRDLPWVNKKCPCFDARVEEFQNLRPLVLEQ